MEEMQQITMEQWLSWKEDIRRKLAETAGNFVHIGYRLKQIRNSGMLDGCADIFEFAQKEYGLGKSTVSRFIAINEKFSEGGDSLELKAEYRQIGSSKLAEMLTLTDSECQLITERTTVKEIRELKQFSRQQAPEEMVTPAQQHTPFQKCIIAYMGQKEKREVLNRVMDMLMDVPDEEVLKDAAALVNPGEYATFKKGIIFLFLYDYKTGVKYKSMVEPEPVSLSWPEFLLEIMGIYSEYYQSGDDTWANFYGDPMPEPETERAVEKKEEKVEKTAEIQSVAPVATSQQEAENPPSPAPSESVMEEEKEEPDEPELEEDESETGENAPAAGMKEEEQPAAGVQEEPGGEDDLEKLIENIQDLGDQIEEIYSWGGGIMPATESVRKVRRKLMEMHRQVMRLEHILTEEEGKDE